jgi:hypothetical protein
VCGYVLFGYDEDNLPEGIEASSVVTSFTPHKTAPVPSYVVNVRFDPTGNDRGTFHLDEEEEAEEADYVTREEFNELVKLVNKLTKKQAKEETATPETASK